MNVVVSTALQRVVADMGATAGFVIHVGRQGSVTVASSTHPALVGDGNVWLSTTFLDDGTVSTGTRLVTDPAAFPRLVPTGVRLALEAALTGVLVLPIAKSASRLVLLWCGTTPGAEVLERLHTGSVEVFTLLAPLLEAHATVRATATHLEAIVGALDHAVVVTAEMDGMAELNAAAAALLRLPAGSVPAGIVAEALRALRLRSDDHEAIETRANELMADPNMEVRGWIWSFPGTPSHLRVNSVPLRGADDMGRVWVFEDVSAQMRLLEAEQQTRMALAESELRYRLIAENASDVVFQSSAGITQWVSPNSAATLGWEPDELIGHTTTHLWHPEDRSTAIATREAAYEGNASRAVLRMITKDQRVRWVEVGLQPYREADGQSGAVGLLHDVTERVLAEQALAESEAQARQMAEQYREASREAQEANLAKNRFLSRMSHELRTPLNAVIGFSQLLQMDHLTEQQRTAVQHIRSGGEHLLQLINEVLDISRIEAGELALVMEPVAVLPLIEDALDLVRPAALSAGVELFEPPAIGPAPHVMADRRRALQALLNLLSNAVKYNRPGGRVELSVQEQANGRIAILVRDTGLGIAPAHLSRLFQPFDRLGAEATAIEGTGIGLALTRSLVDAMGGHIVVESEEGVGSCFTVVLNSSQSQVGDDQRHDAPESVSTSSITSVLYIEDNAQNVELMRRIVSRRPGVDLRVATTGEEGLTAAIGIPPELIFLDLHLPDMSGEEVLHRLRATPTTAGVAVVVLTADASVGVRSRLLSAGADEFLTKPIDVVEVLRWIDSPTR